MSTRVPPDDPRRREVRDQESSDLREKYADLRQRYVEAVRDAVSQHDTLEPLPAAIPERMPESVGRVATASQSGVSGWVTTALQSVTLVTIVGCAFWLGSLSTTVTTTAQKLDKLNDGVVGISKDSLSNRLTTIETKLDNLDKKLEQPSPRR